jgi:hypothetical protein
MSTLDLQEVIDEVVKRADSNEDRIWHVCKNQRCPLKFSKEAKHNSDCGPFCGADVPPKAGNATYSYGMRTMDICIVCAEISDAGKIPLG